MTTPDANPYASPRSDDGLVGGHTDGIHQQGPLTVIPIGSTLPEVCLFTGKRGTGSYDDKKLVWCPPWVAIFILLNVIVLLIVYFFVKKQGQLKFYVDNSVRRKRAGLLKRWGWVTATAVALMVADSFVQSGVLVPVGLLLFIVDSVVVLFRWPRLTIAKIDKRFIYLKGLPREAVEILCTARVDESGSTSSAAGF